MGATASLKEKDVVVHMTSSILDEIDALAQAAEGEFTTFGLIKSFSKGIIVVDALMPLPEQVASGDLCRCTDAADMLLVRQAHEMRRSKDMRVWIHSHATHDVFFSATDIDFIERFGRNAPYLLSMVVNHAQKAKLRLDIFDPLRYTIEDISVFRINDFDRLRAAKAQILEKLSNPLLAAILHNVAWEGWPHLFGVPPEEMLLLDLGEKTTKPSTPSPEEAAILTNGLPPSTQTQMSSSGEEEFTLSVEDAEAVREAIAREKKISRDEVSATQLIARVGPSEFVVLPKARLTSGLIKWAASPEPWLRTRMFDAKLDPTNISFEHFAYNKELREQIKLPLSAILRGYQTPEMIKGEWWSFATPPWGSFQAPDYYRGNGYDHRGFGSRQYGHGANELTSTRSAAANQTTPNVVPAATATNGVNGTTHGPTVAASVAEAAVAAALAHGGADDFHGMD